MPELPEVETVCRLMSRVLKGKKITGVKVAPDEIVLGGIPPEAIEAAVLGREVTGVGRKGKYWWIELDSTPWLFGHLGMSGWIRHLGADTIRLHSHGTAPLDDSTGEPKFLKLLLTAEDGEKVAFTDGRRLGRLWLGNSPAEDSRIQKLGFDVYRELPPAEALEPILAKRKVSIKGVLLDQSVFAGVGNWIADEVLFQARIAPARSANTLSHDEVQKLHDAIRDVTGLAVEVGADHTCYPEDWLFVHRWGGSKGSSKIMGHDIVREEIATRTTAWVPSLQK